MVSIELIQKKLRQLSIYTECVLLASSITVGSMLYRQLLFPKQQIPVTTNTLETTLNTAPSGFIPVHNQRRVGVIGSSSTVTNPHDCFTNYVEYLNEYGIGTFDGYGVSGQTTEQIGERFQRQIIDNLYTDVVIFAGLNDLIVEKDGVAFAKLHLQDMYCRAKENGLNVIAATIQPAKHASYWTTSSIDRDDFETKTRELNAWIMDQEHTPYVDVSVDLFSAIEDSFYLGSMDCIYAASDELHMNTQGHKRFAELIYQEALLRPY